MVYFRETQSFAKNPVIWIVLVITALVVGYALHASAPGAARPFGMAIGIQAAIMLWLLSMRLETEVRPEGVRLRFRALWFPKTFEWNRIESAAAVSYHPIADYGGWGIRLGFAGWAWNVSGSRGVRLQLRDGRPFLIGSQEPERLAAAIQERLDGAGDR